MWRPMDLIFCSDSGNNLTLAGFLSSSNLGVFVSHNAFLREVAKGLYLSCLLPGKYSTYAGFY